MENAIIYPDWPAPAHIHAFATTRLGGVSRAPYDSFNLAAHVGDNLFNVVSNRELLKQRSKLPNEPAWLTQTHSTIAIENNDFYQLCEADASYTREKDRVCAVLTADCLPLLVCNRAGTEIAAIHAGWRGLANGIIEATIQKLVSPREALMIWLGPAIGPQAYQVGNEIREAFLAHDAQAANAFTRQGNKHWLLDLYTVARQRLQKLNITAIYGGQYCTFSDERFYSYRRDAITGRMASLIWISK